MRHWSVNNLGGAILILALTISVSANADSSGPDETIPPPCDQFDQDDNRKLCALFLSDPENAGARSFTMAEAVDNFDDFKARLEQPENDKGLILLLTYDIDILNSPGGPIIPRGQVALIGNPNDPPRINISGHKSEIEIIMLAQPVEAGAVIRPQVFYCWGIEWILTGIFTHVIGTSFGYGSLRITHSKFGYTLPVKNRELPEAYLELLLEEIPGATIKNSILIAHNRIINMPGDHLGPYGTAFDIHVVCYHMRPSGQPSFACNSLGAVEIRDNLWEKPLSAEDTSHPPSPDTSHRPSSYDPYPYRAAILMLNIGRVIVSGNRAADPDVTLSVVFQYPFTYEGGKEAVVKNMDIQLMNNVVHPGMNITNRQFYFNGLADDGEDKPLAGSVRMVCNPEFDVIRLGSFAHNEKYNLSIFQANDDCRIHSSTTSTAQIPTTPIYSLLTTMASVTAAPYPSVTVTSSGLPPSLLSTVIPSITSVLLSASSSPSPSASDGGDNEDLVIYGASAAGVAGLFIVFFTWEVAWMTVYKYTDGRTRRLANAMGFFVPYCLRHILLKRAADTLLTSPAG